MAYFLSLWKNDTWKRKAELALTGYPELDYAAAEGFSETNVGCGDTIFIATNIKGTLYIGGSIVVESVVSCRIPDDCIDSKRYLSHPGRLHRL